MWFDSHPSVDVSACVCPWINASSRLCRPAGVDFGSLGVHVQGHLQPARGRTARWGSSAFAASTALRR